MCFMIQEETYQMCSQSSVKFVYGEQSQGFLFHRTGACEHEGGLGWRSV